MVNIYPRRMEDLQGSKEKVPESEKEFYRIVNVLNDDWVIWHSVRWFKIRAEGESDFVIFNKNYGFLVIEAKGGEISRTNDRKWKQSNHEAGVEHTIKDPFRQSSDAMYEIRDLYIKKARRQKNKRQLFRSRNEWYFPLIYGYGVFFPNCYFKQNQECIDYVEEQIFDLNDLKAQENWEEEGFKGISPLERYFNNLFNIFKERTKWKIPPDKLFEERKNAIERFFIEEVVSVNISGYIDWKRFYQKRNKELDKINEVQDFLLKALSKKKRCIFIGSAGTGKTYIAMKKAIMNHNEDLKTLFLCYNYELCNFVETYLNQFIQHKNKITVYSLGQFIGKIIKNLNISIPKERKLKEHFNNKDYCFIKEEILKNKDVFDKFKYDAILIDETQDIDSNLWELFNLSLKDIQNSILYIFYDEQQAINPLIPKEIYTTFGMSEDHDAIILNHNLRNTNKIAKWLSTYSNLGNYSKFSGISGEEPITKKFSNLFEALEFSIGEISKYYEQGINLDRIAILSNRRLQSLDDSGVVKKRALMGIECDCCNIHLSKGNLYRVIHPKTISEFNSINFERKILFKPISEFKGLERDIIFLILPKEFKENRFKNLGQYLGASRAKFKLYYLEIP